MPTSSTDAVDEAATGNPMGDFEACVGPLRDDMVLLARRLTRSKAAAEDVVQEAMIRAWRAWPRWSPQLTPGREVTPESAQALLRQWMFRITQNAFSNIYRSHMTEMRAYGDEAGPGAAADAWHAAHGDDPSLPSEGVFKLGDEVTEALDAVLPERRDLMLLAATDMKPVEIASVTGIPYGTVNSRMFRARADLSERLAEYAAREYGIGPLSRRSGRARVDAAGDEPAEVVEADADGVDDVVSHDDDCLALGL